VLRQRPIAAGLCVPPTINDYETAIRNDIEEHAIPALRRKAVA